MRESLRALVHDQPWSMVAVLIALHVAVGVLAFAPVPHAGGDNVAYLSLAQSLLEQGRYVELWHPGHPPHTQYPPGFPVILAVAWTLGLRSWLALKLMMVGFTAVAVATSYLWVRARTGAAAAAAIGGVLAVAPGLVAESQWILSDIPFWAATMAALLAIERGRDRWAIALAFLALTLRIAGLPLVVAILLWLAFRRRWKPAAVTAVIVAGLAVAWTARMPATAPAYTSQLLLENPYAPELGRAGALGLLERVLGNLEAYGLEIVMRTLTDVEGLVLSVIGAALMVFAAIGFLRRLAGSGGPIPGAGSSGSARRRGRVHEVAAAPLRVPFTDKELRAPHVVELFALAYGGMLLIWPVQWASNRFLIPFLPVLLAYAVEGTRVIPHADVRRFVRLGALVLILGFAAGPSWRLWNAAARCRSLVETDGIFSCTVPRQQAFLELARSSRGRLPDGAVVLSRKPRLWYWFSGYAGDVYPFSVDRSRLLTEASEVGADYVVLDRLGTTSRVYLLPALRQYRRWFCLIERQLMPTGPSASLLGILPQQWDPEHFGIDGDPEAEGLRLPRCRPGGRPTGRGGG